MKTKSIVCFISILLFATSGFAQKKKSKKEEKPGFYTIYEKSTFLSITVKKEADGPDNTVTFDTRNVSGGVPTIRGEILPPAVISDIDRLQGSYSLKTITQDSGRGQTFVLKDVNFPFRARYTMGRVMSAGSTDDLFDLEITEPGAYTVIVSQKR